MMWSWRREAPHVTKNNALASSIRVKNKHNGQEEQQHKHKSSEAESTEVQRNKDSTEGEPKGHKARGREGN